MSAKHALRVRAYNVLFGDAILVSVPESDRTRHILIDVGNVQSGPGGSTDVFAPVIADIQRELGGEPIDLYVMTHEHMDHVKGLLYAAEQLAVPLRARFAWLTASADPEYGRHYPEAEKQKKLGERALESARAALAAAPNAQLEGVLLNNDYRATGTCVDHLRTIADTTTYIHRETPLDGTHPFREAKLAVWAPEADTSEYYGKFTPAAGFVPPAAEPAPTPGGTGAKPAAKRLLPPAGVDTTAFHNLVDCRASGHADNLYTIDRAANNTSIVFSLDWQGWTLLFAGDAELRSWKAMAKHKMLRAVDFLKVAHHGSSNGTPAGDIVDAILPAVPAGARERYAVVSTCLDSYSGVPDDVTLAALAQRCTVRSVLDLPRDQIALDVLLEAPA